MNLALLIVGICAVLAGLLAIIFGMTIREFSLGGTLIVSGTIGVCSGMLLVGLHLVLLELKGIARRLAGAVAPSEVRVRPVLPGLAVPGAVAPEPVAAAAVRAEPPPPPPSPAPWQSEAVARERPRAEAPQQEPEAPTPPPGPEPPRRRNLLFASTSRKERERAEAKSTETAPPPAELGEAPNLPPASFDVAWPKPDRTRTPEPLAAPRRPPPPPPPRSPATFAETTAAPPPEPPPSVEPAPVTVLKSGVVDGMAYSLYSDGSIEAQMPEGMMRFASIDELRAHLDQRG
ncbi:DUF308 domain-containing protein [Bradyrhizobium sp. CNPSo 4010]|uniref:DUF308 domain-containing protein n=1 Tax=Bradyrhizobium agreste TaxID=2751811 RepID=A0ABS0PR99_9BRAD|nr:DUF308 domain-containing protein [Bradyrhizobium agreste]MBH5399605.1 DUF308 domain-containing protein [Bradyrhizobium agreste]